MRLTENQQGSPNEKHNLYFIQIKTGKKTFERTKTQMIKV